MVPDCLDSQENEAMKLFQIDSAHFRGSVSPVILKIKHARLRNTQYCVWFEMCFQTVVALLALSEKNNMDMETCAKTLQDWTQCGSFERIAKFLFK